MDEPPGWIFSHSDNHWQQKETMKEFVEQVLIADRKKAIEKLGLSENQMALRYKYIQDNK